MSSVTSVVPEPGRVLAELEGSDRLLVQQVAEPGRHPLAQGGTGPDDPLGGRRGGGHALRRRTPQAQAQAVVEEHGVPGAPWQPLEEAALPGRSAVPGHQLLPGGEGVVVRLRADPSGRIGVEVGAAADDGGAHLHRVAQHREPVRPRDSGEQPGHGDAAQLTRPRSALRRTAAIKCTASGAVTSPTSTTRS